MIDSHPFALDGLVEHVIDGGVTKSNPRGLDGHRHVVLSREKKQETNMTFDIQIGWFM